MVLPGSLSFEVIRGIQFDSYVLECRDENVVVTSDQSGVSGTYVPCGQFGGFDLFILAGAPSWFLFYNAAAATYVIAQTLTTAALTNFFLSVTLTEPTGSYTGQGSYAAKSATADDNPVDLTGYNVSAFVRRSANPGAEIVQDLAPTVTDAATGEITIPLISKDDTELLRVGNFFWDLVLIDAGSGERFGPFAKGSFNIVDNITSSLVPS